MKQSCLLGGSRVVIGCHWFALFLGLIFSPATVNADNCLTPPPGLISWWKGDGNAADYVAGDNGVLVNGAGYAPGKVSQAFSFNGTNQYVQVAYNPAWNFGTSDFSFEFWTRLADPGRNVAQAFMALDSGPGNTTKWIFWLNNGLLQLVTSEYGGPAVNYPFHPNANEWHHLGVTRSNNVVSYYLDGSLINQITWLSALPSPNVPLTIGAAETNFFLAGEMDELAFYNRALTTTEIQSIFAAGSLGKCPPTAPPAFASQPLSQIAYVGDNVNLSASLTNAGVAQVEFWLYNGAPIPGASNMSLSMGNVQTASSGNYALVVSNLFGTATSSVATLTVNARACAPPNPGIVGWWPGEGNVRDVIGQSDGTLAGGAGYGSGEVGQTFAFGGSTQTFTVPAGTNWNFVNNTSSLEFWVNFTSTSGRQPLAANLGASYYQVWSLFLQDGTLQFQLAPGFNNPYNVVLAAWNPTPNQWHHVALTQNGNLFFTLYTDGNPVAGGTSVNGASLLGNGLTGLSFGGFAGGLDEISIYNRELSYADVQAIYHAGNQGKCAATFPPTIVSQPQSQTVNSWTNASFAVAAQGTGTLTYQWRFNGVDIPGETNGVLNLHYILGNAAGAYTVKITNPYGSTVSSAAVLTVIPPPSLVQIPNLATTSAVVVVPITLLATGAESQLGFSLAFDPTKLTFAGLVSGADTLGALALVSTASAASGRVGLSLEWLGGTFPPGTQEVAVASFFVNSPTNPATTALAFGDVPVPRLAADGAGTALPSLFLGASITIPWLGYEGDLTPLPNGDGVLTINDWVKVGRLVLGLDAVTSPGVFQRADCAPRSTFGDGALTVADWVQAGRYASGVDPLTVSAGPMGAITATNVVFPNPARILQLVSTNGVRGQVCQMSVQLTALGNENALGFSLAFDPAQLNYAGITLGKGATHANLMVNDRQAVNGSLGILLAQPTGTTFSAGLGEVAKVNFVVASGAANSVTVGFANTPCPPGTTDSQAQLSLGTTYQGATVTVSGFAPPALRVASSTAGLRLTWPANADGYLLQTTGNLSSPTWTPVVMGTTTNGTEQSMTLPVTGSGQQFYRLYHP